MTRAIRDCRNCGGAGCRECGNEGIEDVACFTPPASFTVRSDEVGFEDDRENCPCYEGVKINDGVDQCLHPDNRTAGNWCALDTCPLLRACIKYQPAPRPKQREVARIGDMHQADALPAVPDGMVLVPKVPTPEMDAAGRRALSENGVDCVEDSDALVCYAAMLAATPAHDQPEGSDK